MVKSVGADQRDACGKVGKWWVQSATRQACWTLAWARNRSLPQQTKTTSDTHDFPQTPHLRLNLPPGDNGDRGRFPYVSSGLLAL